MGTVGLRGGRPGLPVLSRWAGGFQRQRGSQGPGCPDKDLEVCRGEGSYSRPLSKLVSEPVAAGNLPSLSSCLAEGQHESGWGERRYSFLGATCPSRGEMGPDLRTIDSHQVNLPPLISDPFRKGKFREHSERQTVEMGAEGDALSGLAFSVSGNDRDKGPAVVGSALKDSG